MKYDIAQARSEYDFTTGQHRGANFAQFSPAYASTNEDIREIMTWSMRPKPGQSVLTVAGSGDQALHYAMAGASHIDTFDITFNAKMMMDIKTTAIQKLNFKDFRRLICMAGYEDCFADILQYQQIEDALPADIKQYVRDMRGAQLIRRGMGFDGVYNDEFEKLRKIIKGPFNFIWTDLKDLSRHLKIEYDQIYLSNILQYHARSEYVTPLVLDLTRFLKPGGIMMVNVAPFFADDDLEVVMHLRHNVEKQGIGTVDLIHNHLYDMCVLKKR